ncbi:MAG: UbiX family flavin prenyltransferase [Bacteroidales bacterium]|nr:UbiX family flavin prenyltransferase [Bacteroidales bacterium]
MRKIIVAVTGASGAIYAKLLLNALSSGKDTGRELRHYDSADAKESERAEIAVIFSDNAKEIWEHELGEKVHIPEGVTLFKNTDFYAPFASGSSDWDTMIVCPASMGMLGRIAGGISNDLISRAADVMLKERRRLILVPRETPYSLIHLNNMKLLTEAGAVICPATPSFYSQPKTIDGLVMTVVERILDLADIGGERFRWGGETASGDRRPGKG